MNNARPALVWCVGVAILMLGSTPGIAGPTRPFVAAGLCVMPKRGDKEGNLARLEGWARAAATQGAQLVITPESFLDGYLAKHAKFAARGRATVEVENGADETGPRVTREEFLEAGESLDGPVMSRIGRLAAELGIHLAVGFSERRGDEVFNTMVLFSPAGRPVLRYAKTHNAEGHEIYTTTGRDFPVVDTPYGRWGALICFDRQLPETARILALKGAGLIMIPSFGGYGDINDALIRARAYENGVWVMFVHPRRGLVVDPRGNVVAQSGDDGDRIVFATIAWDERVANSAVTRRRPEIYRELVDSPSR